MCLYTGKRILNMFQNIQQINSNCNLGGLLKLITRQPDKYTILVYWVNIEFMWRGLETGEKRVLASISTRFVSSHIHSIFTVKTPILYLSRNKTCPKKMLFNLKKIIIKNKKK